MPARTSLDLLIRAIGRLDSAAANEYLEAAPALARDCLAAGATRVEPKTWYFERIGHHAYAGDTALHLAAAAYLPMLVSRLLQLQAGPGARNRRGAEPLHYAADGIPGSASWNPAAQTEVIERLLAAGADVNAQTLDGVTPLHRAVRTRCSAAVQALLSAGAEVRLQNHNGSTAWDLAKRQTGRGGSGGSEARAEQARIIELLERQRGRDR
jgi:ankyrin repeat protein